MKDKLYYAKKGLQSQGRTAYLKYLETGNISLKNAVLAKCYECMGYFADGRKDCEMPDCPLYPYMLYGEKWKNRKKRPFRGKKKNNGSKQRA